MTRLIDADAMIADLLTVDPRYETMIDWCCRVLDAQPTIDAVPVVRCKDCKHRPWKVYDDKGKFLGVDAPDEMCPCQCEDNFYNYVPDDDWFCANGERKENA